LEPGRFEGKNGRFGKYVDLSTNGKSARLVTVITAAEAADELPEVKFQQSAEDIAFDLTVNFYDGRTASVYIDQQRMETR
jgi:hypothetical protein